MPRCKHHLERSLLTPADIFFYLPLRRELIKPSGWRKTSQQKSFHPPLQVECAWPASCAGNLSPRWAGPRQTVCHPVSHLLLQHNISFSSFVSAELWAPSEALFNTPQTIRSDFTSSWNAVIVSPDCFSWMNQLRLIHTCSVSEHFNFLNAARTSLMPGDVNSGSSSQTRCRFTFAEHF